MSTYDDQLRAIENQYSGLMGQLPAMGVSQNAINTLQGQILPLAQQLQDQAKQWSSALRKTSREQADLAKSDATTALKAVQDAANFYNKTGYSWDATHVGPKAPDWMKRDASKYGQVTTGDLLPNVANYLHSTGQVQDSVDPHDRDYYVKGLSDYYTKYKSSDDASKAAAKLSTEDLADAVGIEGKIPGFASGAVKDRQMLEKLMQDLKAKQAKEAAAKTADAASKGIGTPDVASKLASIATGGNVGSYGQAGASKGGAAASSMVSGMPQQDQAQKQVNRVNQIGSSGSSPFTMPSFSGLTFGGNA
jgi:hypothetical protein